MSQLSVGTAGRTNRRVWFDRGTLLWTVSAAALIAVVGCIGQVGPTPTPEPGGSLSGAIKNLQSNLTLSGDQSLTVIYDAGASATSVSAFYVTVTATGASPADDAPRVVFAQDLSTGEGKTTTLQTASMELGLYRVGLTLSDGTNTLEVLSIGSLEISGLPDPTVNSPLRNITATPGEIVEIRITVGDPENAVNWRLFYLEEDVPRTGSLISQLGTQIDTGTSNEIIYSWDTTSVPLGTYVLGISVTDSGQTVAQTAAAGETGRIVTLFNDPYTMDFVSEVPDARPPTVSVTKPATDATLLTGESYQIRFSAVVYEGDESQQSLKVFYDFDGEADTGDEEILSESLPITATSVAFNADLIEEGDTIYIGVTADDGVNDPVTAYGKGTITRDSAGDALLQVTKPNSKLAVRPGDTVNIAWTTSLESSTDATVEVDVQRVNSSNNPVGTAIQVLEPSSLNVKTTSYTTTESGKYQVTVTIDFDDNTLEDLTATAPELITVSSTPTVLWLGELAGSSPAFDGAIFEGVNYEDNAGSAFAGGEDFDQDGLDEMFIVARYGKPDFINPSGIGAGEAYMIRGTSSRYIGTFNLNAVAGSQIPGFVFTGIEPDPDVAPEETDGLASIFITTDADGDNIGELAFGFPHTYSQQKLALGGPSTTCEIGDVNPQFTRGGVVIVSSRNTELTISNYDRGGRRCPLDNVGQYFSLHNRQLPNEERSVSPEPGEGALCSGASSWMEDILEWFTGDCDSSTADGQYLGCINSDTGDGEQETLKEPTTFGFDKRLADPYPCEFGVPCRAADLPAGCPASDPNGTDCDRDQVNTNAFLCAQTIALNDADTSDTACDPQDASEQEEAALQSLPLGRAWIEPYLDSYLSGFYRERFEGAADSEGNVASPVWNHILRTRGNNQVNASLIGCRIIGESVDEACGSWISQSDDNLIIMSPFSNDLRGEGGVGYTINDWHTREGDLTSQRIPRLWQLPEDLDFNPYDYPDNNMTPPQPHQYLVGGNSNWGTRPGSVAKGRHEDTGGLRLIGESAYRLQTAIGVPDFNGDSREDFAVGAPHADIDSNGVPEGAVFVAFRRTESLEDDYVLADLALSTNNANRLAGVVIREEWNADERLGESIAGGFDFDGDGSSTAADIAIGNPDGNGGTGKVIIVFGSSDLITGRNGMTVDDLIEQGHGARITGVEKGSDFGINVANIGDIDGDGRSELAIAAPNATPHFDSVPTDSNDSLNPTENTYALPGLDLDLDGEADNVSGPLGVPDYDDDDEPIIDKNDKLYHAGLVYVILSSTDPADFILANDDDDEEDYMEISIGDLGGAYLDGFIIVGRRGERYSSGGSLTYEGDYLGGGDAGLTSMTINNLSIDYGGNVAKAPVDVAGSDYNRSRGRSYNLGRAGDIDGDGRDDFLIGAQLADPRVNTRTGEGTRNAGEAYLIYGFKP